MEYRKPAILCSQAAALAIQSTHTKQSNIVSDNSPLPPNFILTSSAYEADE